MDELEILQLTREEHNRVKSNLITVGQAVNDMEAVFRLQHADAEAGQQSIKGFLQNLWRLRDIVETLALGMERHFFFEEQNLPPVLGPNLMEGLAREHEEIRAKFLSCQVLLRQDTLDYTTDQVLSLRTSIQTAIGDLIGMLESHAAKEEAIFSMVEKALLQTRNR